MQLFNNNYYHIINNREQNNSIGISKYNRTEKKNHNEKFKTNKKLINTNSLFKNEKECSKVSNNKLSSILLKIKSIEKQILKKNQSTSMNSIENKKSNIKQYNENLNMSINSNKNRGCNTTVSKKNFKKIDLNNKSDNRNNHITINNNYYTIINNMTINDIKDMEKFNKNFSVLKLDENYHNYNTNNSKNQPSKNESKNIFLIRTNNMRSRNQINISKNYNKSNLSYGKNKLNYKCNISINKNRMNNSFIDKKRKKMNNSVVNNKKRNLEIVHDKNISLKERIHLFHKRKEALVKQYLNRHLERKENNIK